MPERHRLGRLQMGKARHDGIGMRFRLIDQNRQQRVYLRHQMVNRIAYIKPEIRRHLVIARTRRVQPTGRLADQLGQPRFNIHMNVFQRAREIEIARFHFRCDFVQAVADCRPVFSGNNALFDQHIRMRQ